MSKVFSLLICFVLLTCDNDHTESVIVDKNEVQLNKLLLLRVNFMTYRLEGGNEQVMNCKIIESDTIPIKVDYQVPGDFGNLALYYEPTNELIFDGSIIWLGTGTIKFPTKFKPAFLFSLLKSPLDKPDNSRFQLIFVGAPDGRPPFDIDYTLLWNSISKLDKVSEYLKSNKKIGLFIYTPAVGFGDPYGWDWFIVMNK